MSKRDEQIARMKGLMTYGMVTESKRTPVKDSIEGPDGKVYAIIREGAKYYIKSTPKGSELVAESFDYIGGFMNKKNNEYPSYNQASKNLELKMRSLNEAYGVKKNVEMLNPEKKETLMVEMTDAMKSSLARYRQIMNNTAGIMNESAAISMNNTGVPEAPKTSAFSPKLGEPFTNTAEATLDTDLKKTANAPEKQGEPFGDNQKVEEYKDAQYVPDGSVANKKPSGGKVVRVNESDTCIETIEECDEWGSCGLPATAGTGEVGDDAPFTEPLHEDESLVGFAEEPTYTEDEEEDEIDLDDIDLDLEEPEEEDDEDIDDIDVEDLDDEGDEDEIEIEIDDEESELESLRSEVEELRSLVQSLLDDDMSEEDDDEEDTYELELDDDGDDEYDSELELDDDGDDEYDSELEESEDYFHNPNLPDDKQLPPPPAEVRFPEMMGESRRSTKKMLTERVVEYVGGYHGDFTPNNEKAREGEAFGNVGDNGEIKGANKKGMWWLTQCEIWDMGLNGLDEQFAINCLKNVYRCHRNIDLMLTSDEYTPDEITDMADVMDEEMDMLNKLFSSRGLHSPNLTKIADECTFRSNKAYELADSNAAEVNDVDVDDDVDFEDEDDVVAPAKPQRDFDKENDDAAYANAAKNAKMFNFESRSPRRLNEEGTRLNVFGKHPGYRKKPMNLPRTGEDRNQWGQDWNDESVYSEQPFGQKVGDSAPFDNVVKSTVDSIVESLKKKI